MSIYEPESAAVNFIHADRNRRKRSIYWLGFLEGTLASKQIERLEIQALEAEAKCFAEIFGDCDASDLVQDIRSIHLGASDSEDLYAQVNNIIAAYREELFRFSAPDATDEVNQFLGNCAGAICDSVILQREAEFLIDRFTQYPSLQQSPVLRKLEDHLNRCMHDGFLSADESESIREWVARLVGDGYKLTGLASFATAPSLPNLLNDHSLIDFDQRNFVITGPLKVAPRHEIEAMLVDRGAAMPKSVSKKVDYLVVAMTPSLNWKHTHFGTKIEYALELIEKGAKIQIVSEPAFTQAIVSAPF